MCFFIHWYSHAISDASGDCSVGENGLLAANANALRGNRFVPLVCHVPVESLLSSNVFDRFDRLVLLQTVWQGMKIIVIVLFV